MSKVSGFDPLFTAIENSCDCQVQNYFFPQIASEQLSIIQMVRRKLSFLYVDNTSRYRINPFIGEQSENIAAKVILVAEQNPDALVLLSAGEDQFSHNFINANDSVKKRIVIFLHQPPSWLRLQWRDFSALNALGAIICLSEEQREFISGVCTSPTILIKHGVCHDFFRPDPSNKVMVMPRLLFVGQWLRDFDTLAGSMELIWQERPDTLLNCVIPRFARNHSALMRLARDKRVTWHADITPEALRDIYLKSTILFLPLIDATANNSIVEALASGLPIVSSNVGGIPDYVPDNIGELCIQGDVHSHAQAVINLFHNYERMNDYIYASRKFAEYELDWERIARKLVSELKASLN